MPHGGAQAARLAGMRLDLGSGLGTRRWRSLREATAAGAWKNAAVGLVSVGVLCLVFVLWGRASGVWVVTAADSRLFRLGLFFLTGLLFGHLLLAWLDLLAIPWHPAVLAGAILGLYFLARRTLAAPAGAPPSSQEFAWADATALAVVAVFALLAASQRIAFADFVYHWGIKGHRYFLHRGIDYEFLTQPWNLLAHPEYPQLLPELFALTAIFAGDFSESAMFVWSAVFFGLLLVAAREALSVGRVEPRLARYGLASLALVVGTFGVGYLMAGSADWVIALVLVASLPALLGGDWRGRELQVGVLAALGAAAKLEGVSLGMLLIASVLARLLGDGQGLRARQCLRLGAPFLVAVLPWLVQGVRHGLFDSLQSGSFEVSRAPLVFGAIAQSLLRPEWHLVPLVVLPWIPALFFRPETRLLGWVLSLQLGVYLGRYFTATFDVEFSVLSSFPRLLFHLVPALVVGLLVALDRWLAERGSRGIAVIRRAAPR